METKAIIQALVLSAISLLSITCGSNKGTGSDLPDDPDNPPRVYGMRVLGSTTTSVTLTWRLVYAPHAGGYKAYDLRYDTNYLYNSGTSFIDAIQVEGEPSPKGPGTADTLVVTGLEPSTVYYFAMNVSDSMGNWSGIHAPARCMTLPTISTWMREVEGLASARDMVQTSDGGYILVGYETEGVGTDISVTKVNSLGFHVWHRTFGSDGNDIATGIAKAPDEGWVIAGTFGESLLGQADVFLLKIDESGNTIWQDNFSGGHNDGASSIVPVPGGGYVAAGQSWSYGPDSTYANSAYLVRVNEMGELTWQETYHDPFVHPVSDIAVASDGGFILVNGYAVIKVSESGTLLWQQPRGPEGGFAYNGSLSFILPTQQGNYFSMGTTSEELYVTVLNGAGQPLWETAVDGLSGGRAVIPMPDGGYVVGGYRTGYLHVGTRVAGLDQSGNPAWVGSPGVGGRPYSIVATNDGGYLMAGAFGKSLYPTPAALLKVDSKGHIDPDSLYWNIDSQ